MKCQHLADGHGFYLKIVASYRQYYNPNGEAVGTDDGINGRSRGGEVAYCENCDQRLGVPLFRNGRMSIKEEE